MTDVRRSLWNAVNNINKKEKIPIISSALLKWEKLMEMNVAPELVSV